MFVWMNDHHHEQNQPCRMLEEATLHIVQSEWIFLFELNTKPNMRANNNAKWTTLYLKKYILGSKLHGKYWQSGGRITSPRRKQALLLDVHIETPINIKLFTAQYEFQPIQCSTHLKSKFQGIVHNLLEYIFIYFPPAKFAITEFSNVLVSPFDILDHLKMSLMSKEQSTVTENPLRKRRYLENS